MKKMILPGGIEFYSFRDTRFKQGALSIQFLRKMEKTLANLKVMCYHNRAIEIKGSKCPFTTL